MYFQEWGYPMETTHEDMPWYERKYADDVCHAGALSKAVTDALEGQKPMFIRPLRGPDGSYPKEPTIQTFQFAVTEAPNAIKVFRWCDANGDPHGPGTYEIISALNGKGASDPVRVALVIAARWGLWIFRVCVPDEVIEEQPDLPWD